MTPEIRKTVVWSITGVYLSLNVAFFWLDPFSSPWHYHDHHPKPLAVSDPSDSSLTLSAILQYLDEIDIAYGAMEPGGIEEAKRSIYLVISTIFLPATMGLHVHEFIGYLGPPTHDQRAFTLSVKARYNHLAQMAVDRGYRGDRYLFELEASLSKKKSTPFSALVKHSAKYPGRLRTLADPQTSAQTPQMRSESSLPVADFDRSDAMGLRSINGDVKSSITFVNRQAETVDIYWRNYQGGEILYRTLQPGQSYDQDTFQTHPWVVRNRDGRELMVVVASDRPLSAIVTPN